MERRIFMKKFSTLFCGIALAAMMVTMALAVIGCGGGGGGSKKPSIVSITVDGFKEEFNLGESFSLGGLRVAVLFSDGSEEVYTAANLPSGLTINSDAYKPNEEGTYSIVVSFQGQTRSYTVRVVDPATVAPGQVAAVTANPPAGDFTASQNVTLSSSTAGAEIWYTIDGSIPVNAAPSIRFVSGTPISITAEGTTLITARAFKADMDAGPVLEAAYTITITGGSGGLGTVSITPTSATVGTDLTAVYTGSETVTWQWQRVLTPDAPRPLVTNIPDATSNTHTPEFAGHYQVRVSATGFTSITSNLVVVSNATTVLPGTVSITPASGPPGTVFVATYSGTETVTWQWQLAQRDEIFRDISGATISAFRGDQLGFYRVVVLALGFEPKISEPVLVRR